MCWFARGGAESPAGFRFCGACGAALPPEVGQRELRKTLTVLFCDLAGSTRIGETLDPERVQELLSAYFDRMRSSAPLSIGPSGPASS